MSSPGAMNPEELGRLYDDNAAAVHRLAFRIRSQRQEAEDLTHDVFLRVRRGGYSSERVSIRQYLLLLTRSMSLNRLRKLSNRRRILKYFKPGSGSNEPIDIQAIDAYVNLELALCQLSSREQQILVMSYREDISQSNIARTLQLPLEAVKTISRRALLKLRHALSSQQRS